MADELADEPHWWHHNAANFFNLRIVQRTCAIQVHSNLSLKICYADEILRNFLGHNIGITTFLHQQPNISTWQVVTRLSEMEVREYDANLYILKIHIYMIYTMVKICGWYCSDSPISLGTKRSLLIGTCGDYYEFITMNICCPSCYNCQLACFFCL